jgi:phosphatidate cytidylyltransferase
MAFKTLARRVGAGAVLIPIVLLIAHRGGALFAGFVALVAAVGSYEFARMAAAGGFRVSQPAVVAASALVALSFHLGSLPLAGAVLTAILLIVLTERIFRVGVEEYASSVSLSLAAVLYTGWLPGFFILIRQLPAGLDGGGRSAPGDAGWAMVALVLILSWSNDSGAYFVGSALGRHKLIPRVSPSKTVEGALGGIACCVAAALIARATFTPFLTAPAAVAAGIVVGAACILGDLAESMLKRSTGVKDSSHLIPGHGGLLDRFDSLLFAGPVFYLVARITLSGVTP